MSSENLDQGDSARENAGEWAQVAPREELLRVFKNLSGVSTEGLRGALMSWIHDNSLDSSDLSVIRAAQLQASAGEDPKEESKSGRSSKSGTPRRNGSANAPHVTEVEISSNSRLLAPTKATANRLKHEDTAPTKPKPAENHAHAPFHPTQIEISSNSRLLAPTKATSNRLKHEDTALTKPKPAENHAHAPFHPTQIEISSNSRLLAPTKAAESRMKNSQKENRH